ncbi:MAG: trypsin-like peptidase domain-containing protein [Candidatus Omnitrophica bacterium]|nr:trypsin-like peptidase domain-containing protein [Candidatus Omnitrophota bacterium]
MRILKLKLIISLFACVVVWDFYPKQAAAMDIPNSVLELEQTITAIAEQSGKTVVSISTQKTSRVRSYMRGSQDDLFAEFFQDFFYGQTPTRERIQLGLGSGVIIDRKGYILTNEHVISGAEVITVSLSDGRKFNAVLKGSDYRSDLAIIKIEADDLPFAELGDSDTLRIGQWAIAVGNPFGFAAKNPKPTVNLGVISSLHRSLPTTAARDRAYLDLIQTDASINPGNSGGPLMGINGQVMGINVAISSSAVGSAGIGFSIPINDAKGILNKLLKGEEVLYGWLGLEVQELNSVLADYFGMLKPDGVLIIRIFENSATAKAGLEVEDIIIKFNDTPIRNTLDLLKEVAKTQAGDEIKIKIIRNGLPRTLKLKMGKLPTLEELVITTSLPPQKSKELGSEKKTETFDQSEAQPPNNIDILDESWRGIKFSPINDDFAEMFNLENTQGVIVMEIEAGTQAERAGIKVNDIITQINTGKIVSVDDFKKIVSKLSGNALVKTNRGYMMIQE